jgi:hypothetical protein
MKYKIDEVVAFIQNHNLNKSGNWETINGYKHKAKKNRE